MTNNESDSNRRIWGSMLGALGVVYGDIGTSPLYAVRTCFHGEHAFAPTPVNVLGVISLITWSLVFIVSVKYVTFVLRADNRGEGGVLALLALAVDPAGQRQPTRGGKLLLSVGVFGAALLYGDGMITPSISVLSAVEGLEVATPVFQPWIVPLTVVVLFGLFLVQRAGTGIVGRVFGPVTLLWFVVLSFLGLHGLLMEPRVLVALNPYYAGRFFWDNGCSGFVVLGAVVLAVTGVEALYADIGHFGAKPIRRAWFGLVFPALLLNYLGQGALLLAQPGAAENPFYNLAPRWCLYPLVALATMATVIAAQALISGAYSITMQAIQLGYLPRQEIRHTSGEERGQIYLPLVNWILMLCCIGLVLGFQSSNRLAAAYGIAVTLTMLITTVLFYYAARRVLHWSALRALVLCCTFGLVEILFFSANAVKIGSGGWFPVVVAALLYSMMSTWKDGRRRLRQRLAAGLLPLQDFLADVQRSPPRRVPGTAVYMSGSAQGTPMALLHNLKHNKVLHERAVLLTIETGERPHVSLEQRVQVEDLSHGIWRVRACYGFMDSPSVMDVLVACAANGLKVAIEDTSFFLSRETLVRAARGAPQWRQRLFAFLARNAQSATAFFGLPSNRVVELGMQVEG